MLRYGCQLSCRSIYLKSPLKKSSLFPMRLLSRLKLLLRQRSLWELLSAAAEVRSVGLLLRLRRPLRVCLLRKLFTIWQTLMLPFRMPIILCTGPLQPKLGLSIKTPLGMDLLQNSTMPRPLISMQKLRAVSIEQRFLIQMAQDMLKILLTL